jgi:hypothetical protein
MGTIVETVVPFSFSHLSVGDTAASNFQRVRPDETSEDLAAAWEVIWGKKDELKGQDPGRQLLSRKVAGEQGERVLGEKVKEASVKQFTVTARLAAMPSN